MKSILLTMANTRTRLLILSLFGAIITSKCFVLDSAAARKSLHWGVVDLQATNDEDRSEADFVLSNTTATASTSTVRFGDSVPVARFGEVVPTRRTAQQQSADVPANQYMIPGQSVALANDEDQDATILKESKQRNMVAAVLSIALAVSSYVWQFTHPVQPVQLLFRMQQNSQPISVIGVNQKPTVVDFWAPWCENCKLIAPTLLQVEEEYKDRVNFVMVDGDKGESWPYIEAFGVDAIPHLALVSAEGDVETALIGPIPKHVLEADLDTLLENAKRTDQHQSLPYRMLDVFANNPEGRRVRFR